MSKRVIDYAYKSYVLNEHSELLGKTKRASLLQYAENQYENEGIIMPILRRDKNELEELNGLWGYCCSNGLENEYNECLKINAASYKRVKRLKTRIRSLLEKPCIFLTLTFNDSTLADTDAKQRRVAVSRYLKSFNCKYVANIDFGSKNHREHYHAIIQADRVNYKAWNKFGNINGEKIRNNGADSVKLAKYVCKLTNHAIKETTKRSCLIYSRA